MSIVIVTMPSASFSYLKSLMTLTPPSDAFDDRGDAHAAANTHADQGALELAALQFVEHRRDQCTASGPQRVAHRDGTADDVELLVRHVEVALQAQGHRCESLVDFDEVDVVDRQPSLRERLARGGPGAEQHDDGIGGDQSGRDHAASRGEAKLLA